MAQYEEDYGPEEEYDVDGPQIVPPNDDRAAAILDGFRMCARLAISIKKTAPPR